MLLLVHGGSEFTEMTRWDSTLQIFFYDPNSFVYKNVIWNKSAWPAILNAGNAPKEKGKYEFENARVGGNDPASRLFRAHVKDLRAALNNMAGNDIDFVVDFVNWIGEIDHLASPRLIYHPPADDGPVVNFCGEGLTNDGSVAPGWEHCDPQRYNQDGAVDRMLKAGVDEIVVVDLTTSGVRFFKSYDVIRTGREVIDQYNATHGTTVTLHWLNDPQDLMQRSYPDRPPGWTNSLGKPLHDPKVPLEKNPNPISSDPVFAQLHAAGIRAQMNPEVAAENTGIMLVNHATRRFNQTFDPKIDDTLILNRNIRDALLRDVPGLRKEHIVGAFMGIKERNPQIVMTPRRTSQMERTRRMRGENLGHAYLYETPETMPDGEWGYLYWEALERLKNQGVQHIVVAFPQITVDSVLNLVELPNQIGKEIGYKNWLYIDQPDFSTYPDVGHPFADYWGVWVNPTCAAVPDGKTNTACCFEMGGCNDGRPYPPPRQTPLTRPRKDMDPSLAFDVSEYGHIGFDPAMGAPDKTRPVQRQYTGTWSTWSPPNDNPRVGQILAKHVMAYLRGAE